MESLQVAVHVSPDEHIDFSHLKRNQKMTQLEFEDEVASDLQRATGLAQTSSADSPSLSRMLQLSGADSLISRLSRALAAFKAPQSSSNADLPQGSGAKQENPRFPPILDEQAVDLDSRRR